MGLIQAALVSAGSVMADQWKEFFYCDALKQDTLMVRGRKRTGKGSSNHGNDNIISNGSIIAVADGQCMLIVDQGKVVDFCAEPGEYKYDISSEPSLFAGELNKNALAATFKAIGRRITFGGDTGKEQRVYYINIKEIMDNKFGTANPIPFRVVDRNINLDIDVSVRCNGVYSYKIVDPLLFYTNVCGNTAGSFSRDEIDRQLKTEFVNALQPSFAKLSEMEVRPNAIPGYVDNLCEAMNTSLNKKWGELRGIKVVSIAMNPITLTEEDAELIKTAQKSGMLKDPTMAAATLAGAQADAMKAAAANTNGAMMGFMGMNMANQAGGIDAGSLYQMGQQAAAQQAAQMQPAGAASWKCSCGTVNTGKFCVECGSPKPAADGWTCSCGHVNKGKFCSECGAPKPAGAPLYKCDKCGWEPEDPTNPPKFCPECGDPFDDNDVK